MFQWHHGFPSCGLGELIGYELALTSLGEATDEEDADLAEEVVRRYRTDAFATAIVSTDIRPGFRYRAKVGACSSWRPRLIVRCQLGELCEGNGYTCVQF